MKMTILTVGKKDEPEYADIIKSFTKRAGYYFDIDWTVIKPNTKSGNIEQIKTDEGLDILKKIKQEDYVILLDEKGNSITSNIFAENLQKYLNSSILKIVFIIGGAYGVSDSVLKRANFVWSLSKLVFPHQLVRLLLIEQIYRAGTILRGEKYHHI